MIAKIQTGAVLNPRELVTIQSERIQVPDLRRIVHLQFRRFAGCPVCNLHLHSFVQRQDEIEAASIREVVVFHSTADLLLLHAGNLPFAVIADPDKRLYAEFGVESALPALLDPRVWVPVLRAVSRSALMILRKRQAVPSLNPRGGRFGLPADFLIAQDGRVLACKYGSHAYDQWSVDELLALVGVEHQVPQADSQLAAHRGIYQS
jgi:peroxiredoxin